MSLLEFSLKLGKVLLQTVSVVPIEIFDLFIFNAFYSILPVFCCYIVFFKFCIYFTKIRGVYIECVYTQTNDGDTEVVMFTQCSYTVDLNIPLRPKKC